MGLAESLKNDAIDAIKRQLFGQLEADIKQLEVEKAQYDEQLANLTARIDSKKSALETVKAALGGDEKPKLDDIYYVASRSGSGDGHFIEYNAQRNILKCSCTGFRYNGKCWASTFIKTTTDYGRSGYGYRSGANILTAFQSRQKPVNAKGYLPYNARNLTA